jgi:acetyl-CoA synthetase
MILSKGYEMIMVKKQPKNETMAKVKGMASENISVLLDEKRVFAPSKEFVDQTNVKRWMNEHQIKTLDELYKKGENWEWFWGEVSKDLVEWYTPYQKVVEWKAPWAKWFVGAQYNIAHDCVDKHVKTSRKNKVAIIFEGEPGDVRKLTYNDLYIEVNKLANALKKMGISKGDRVGIYLPMIPELPIAMIACAKIGAIHSVVFSGFSAVAFRDRVNDCEAKAVITCDSFWRRGKKVALKSQSDEALKEAPSVKHVVVYKRTGDSVSWVDGRDVWWHDAVKDMPRECPTEHLDSNDPLYFLYTSGTTGKPKGIIHAHGGYAVGTALTLKWVFDVKDEDIYWCAADVGWVTGHSYIVYAPLILGATSIIYEGAPDWPQPDRWWDIIEKYGATILYTSPTSVRLFMRLGEDWVKKHDLSTLRLLGSVGEPINPEAWIWYYKNIGGEHCQIMDTWWQTETGHFVISPLPITPLKPGSATRALPGMTAEVFNDEGKPVQNAGGSLVLSHPWPGMLRGIYKNPQRYQDTYWTRFPDIYLAGDVSRKDNDGYFWIQGRADDVLKISGHRIGNSEVESALVSHQLVAEAAVIGKPHELKGESITCYVVLKKGTQPSDQLKVDLKAHVSKELGKIAKPDEIWFVSDVPKTRSGKIMRRVIRAKALGQEVGDTSTLANPEAVDEIGKAT